MIALLIAALPAVAQEDVWTLDDAVESAEAWAKENLDEEVLNALAEADRQKLEQFFREIQQQLQKEYVLDLASLREAARAVLPMLESYEETLPYALWVKSRLDYLDVAEELRKATPVPKPPPGEPPKPVPNPAPELEREIWIKKLADRPWPPAAKPYVPRLKPLFALHGAPPELVWIAEVESSFDPRARSPVGALGLFQLMPATAKRFGLRTWPLDQRRNPEHSAQAAARYLNYLHGRFKDWRLALAAYNAGEGTVEKLLKGQKRKSFDQIATRLPAETQMFVPRVESTLLRREGLRLSQLKIPR